MSKRDLKKYLKSLKRSQLEEQVLELYDKFKPVKVYYNFVFNPKEDKLVEEAKMKIFKEYFPMNGRKPKKRRSVAQKLIKEFITLGVNPSLIADVMFYNLEIASAFNIEKPHTQDSFYTSMFNSFESGMLFISENGLMSAMKPRIIKFLAEVDENNWINESAFFQCAGKYPIID